MMRPNAGLITNYVNERFQHYGHTKRQEVSRLLYEIAKREQCDFTHIVEEYREKTNNFNQFKECLIKRRYPMAVEQYDRLPLSLPELNINDDWRVRLKTHHINPCKIFIERDVAASRLVCLMKNKFPDAAAEIIDSYHDHAKKTKFMISDYNSRGRYFYIVKEKFDFFKGCPCSHKSVRCGYHVINLGSGCLFECSYCYLQDYINSPGIVFPANIEDFFEQFKNYKQDIRIGSGELTDSLIFDHITEFSPLIVNFFKGYPKSTFEFKTKSNNIDLLLTTQPAGNIVISWSVNSQKIIETTEFYTASLEERLKAAVACVRGGFKVAFHFDPIIYNAHWQDDYINLIDMIFDEIPAEHIAWVSLGTLRMTPRLKKIIENRFPENTILDEEFVKGYDGKLRYPDYIRSNIYKTMLERIARRSKNTYVYLCMEEKSVCQTCAAPPLKEYNYRF